jgi:sugar/nucleoside kinase (ribokinase family)
MITVIGDALLDVHVLPAQAPRAGGDVPAEIRLEPGGQGANVAVRLARQGLRVRLACAIGTDAAGDLLRDRLASDGVELVRLPAPATGAVVVLLDERRERTMLSQRVPLARDIADLSPPTDGWLVVSGYVLLEPDAGVPGSAESPRRVLLGCSLDPADVTGWLERARSLAPHLVVLNADEARVIDAKEAPPAELALAVAARLGAIVIVTHPAGATAALDGQSLEIGAKSSGPTVDATGAGDAFSARVIAALAHEPWPPSRDRLEWAMASAVTLAVAVARVPGAQTRVEHEPA